MSKKDEEMGRVQSICDMVKESKDLQKFVGIGFCILCIGISAYICIRALHDDPVLSDKTVDAVADAVIPGKGGRSGSKPVKMTAAQKIVIDDSGVISKELSIKGSK